MGLRSQDLPPTVHATPRGKKEVSRCPGLHRSGALAADDWIEALHSSADHVEKLLPLPALRQPAEPQSLNSSRVRDRFARRLATWRQASEMAKAAGWLYGARGRPLRGGVPLLLAEMAPHHAAAWKALLHEGAKLLDARRSHGMTSGQSLRELVRRPPTSYAPQARATNYVNMQADLIAEPSMPERVVNLLDVLPAPLAEHYASERAVLEGGMTDPDELRVLRVVSQQLTGSKQEYAKYFHRFDVRPLWRWIRDGDHVACCSFKTVPKKDGLKQRKILACLEKNARWGPPPRESNLGLWGGLSLSQLCIPSDSMYVSVLTRIIDFPICGCPNGCIYT